MPLGTPVIGFNFLTGLSSVNGYASGTWVGENGASHSVGTGITMNASGARYRIAAINSLLQPAAWPISIYIRVALASTSYSGIAGIQKGNGTGTPRDTAALLLDSSANLRGQQNNNAGTGGQSTTVLAAVTRGATTSDFSVVHDCLVVLRGTNNGTAGRYDSPGNEVADTSALGTVAAPSYSSAALVIGSVPNDVGNPRMRVQYMGIWDYALSNGEWASLIADPVGSFLTAPPFPYRQTYLVPHSRQPAPLKRQAMWPLVGPFNDTGGGGGTPSTDYITTQVPGDVGRVHVPRERVRMPVRRR